MALKLYLIINDKVGIISVNVTITNVDDRKLVPDMVDNLWVLLYGYKGYISNSLEKNSP
ncbi:transposase [Candidatus Enterovibrio escicola]|uniref:Mobile element protein n=1 Tax=Candidatus Enterovibrio escicola TaxID=1927127 RepID=A0A2A5T5W3_9GAMM|nr:transposase [Candidatus Enterovibrio escacola]PCS23490.1 Mobile element protein [Candidatus Enterovibrio escacola]